jgi:biotin synthase|tara:strand:- start:7177 stop:7386 length:210 start_codon:yes stop_codon:yes gene_type:complete
MAARLPVRPFSTVIDAPVDPKTQQITPPSGRRSVFEDAAQAVAPRTNWTKEEISEVYSTSLIELTYASV